MVETRGSEGADYRDKYRRALDEQERMEKQFTAQLNLLKKAILSLGTAAQGLDAQLDRSLDAMKEKFRKGTGPEIVNSLEIVQGAVTQFERNRLETGAKAAKDASMFIDNLLELKLPGDLQKSLKSFNQGLSKRLVNMRNYPEVLGELSKLQLLALNSASNPEESFWQRIKGGKTLNSKSAEPTQANGEDQHQGQLDDVPDISKDAIDGEISLASETDEASPVYETTEQPSLSGIQFDPGSEDNYEQVAKRIAYTLEGLVEKIEPNDIVRHKVDIVKMRIKRGMDWYVLAVTLEDIRDILLLRYLQTDQDFSEYLKHVNNQLQTISEALGVAVSQEQVLNNSANAFSDCVSEQIGLMQTTLGKTNNIDELKQAVTSNIDTIQKALGDFKQSQKENTTLSEQLIALVNKVQTIEEESEKTKSLLEEERHRATHDSLTGLPNREAYAERAYHEMQRFKRYCRPLTIAVCDIDKFKNINDTYGHQAGDKVIKLIAKLLSTRIRKVDFVARYGGEEFVLIMPETTTDQAYGVLDKIRELMSKTAFRFKEKPVHITISFGLAEFMPEDSVESAFEHADSALYQAKNEGRNRCIVYRATEQET